MSKTKKITASKKNRREKGMRAEFLGSNPHSKGESFSRSWSDREARVQATAGIRRARIVAIVMAKIVRSMWCL